MTLWQLQEMVDILGPDFRVRFLVRNGREVSTRRALGHPGYSGSRTNARILQDAATLVGGRRRVGGPAWRD